MQLALKGADRETAGKENRWSFEHGRRKVGRSHDCDWQIDDGERRVSKLHCTLTRDRDGFVIVDQSANGTLVDGQLLLEGESARLKDGSQINIAGQIFTVAISGDADMEFSDPDAKLRVSDETLTISAILSDIAPNGRSARGVLGEAASNDDWPQEAAEKPKSRAKSMSRNVTIGWNEPPSTGGFGTVLPDDWNDEPVESSKHEHTDALNTPVMVSRPAPRQSSQDFDAVFESKAGNFDADEELPATVSVTPEPIAELLAQLERESAECLAVLDIEPAPARDRHSPLGGRIEALIQQQRQLAATLETMIGTCTQQLEPRLLEAKADTGNDLRSKIERKDWRGMITRTDYWTVYKKQFEEGGRQLSVREFLQRAARGEAAPASIPEIVAGEEGVNQSNEA
ncbi:FHA domain-containing protein [Agrobacterium larrymoorei]|uniref:FHA domain-containing protein n=1 Tax=Agrobacterium larrymoorei TaxID=160699 RepID=UPI001572D968|nr:FHA domain-containing protein [Agrobacterium larrymoorei]NTJ44600.1 FHA domain-containing protein [Agrobacterium larrymoorei]